ncbi:hypothetical protein EON64_02425 [archaeon]|nr:MAG: hypothetical protein EON64_02425 [archaeon]
MLSKSFATKREIAAELRQPLSMYKNELETMIDGDDGKVLWAYGEFASFDEADDDELVDDDQID